MLNRHASVVVRGSGIAAWCCAFLLNKAGIHTRIQENARAALPAILLSPAALTLIRDIFEQPGLFRDIPRIRRRVVAWGAESVPMSLDHFACVISEELLLQQIRASVPVEQAPENTGADWLIVASSPLPDECTENRFGMRSGAFAPVRLSGQSEESCWIESVERGWLFLIEAGTSTGWLLGIGNNIQSLLANSSVIKKRVADCGECSAAIPVSPQISAPLRGFHWLACGSAAMAFDPICGDGTANAIREAILAAAVIKAAVAGADIPSLLSHYETRLVAGFRKHLEMCLEFYSRGHRTEWWQEQSAALMRGLDWCDERLGQNPVFHYRLQGFELRRVR
jgi:hypothetical protein